MRRVRVYAYERDRERSKHTDQHAQRKPKERLNPWVESARATSRLTPAMPVGGPESHKILHHLFPADIKPFHCCDISKVQGFSVPYKANVVESLLSLSREHDKLSILFVAVKFALPPHPPRELGVFLVLFRDQYVARSFLVVLESFEHLLPRTAMECVRQPAPMLRIGPCRPNKPDLFQFLQPG